MKLIREEIESVEFLVEQKNGKKSMYIEGDFLHQEPQWSYVPNGNTSP
jgi:hypothetical protein